MLIHIPMELQHSHLIKVGANILIGHFKLLLSVFFFFIWCYLIFFDIEKKKKNPIQPFCYFGIGFQRILKNI